MLINNNPAVSRAVDIAIVGGGLNGLALTAALCMSIQHTESLWLNTAVVVVAVFDFFLPSYPFSRPCMLSGSQPSLSGKRIILIDPKPGHIQHAALTAPWSNRVSALTPGTVNLLKGLAKRKSSRCRTGARLSCVIAICCHFDVSH